MKARERKPGIYWLGAVDWDRCLFDELIPLPDGTSYNPYRIQGSEKNILIDAIDPTVEHVLMARLNDLGVKKIDYLVARHVESVPIA
jgi:flavorubredoxin